MTPLPNALRLLRDGYRFAGRRLDEAGRDVLATRVAGVPVVLGRGPRAARLVYSDPQVTRDGAFPPRVKATLLGRGGVQGLDDEDHHHRKAMFLDLLGPGRFDGLLTAFDRHWDQAVHRWQGQARVVLHDEVAQVLCGAVCDWAGVPVGASQVPGRTRELLALIESPAAVGPPHWRGRLARRRLEVWLAGLVEDVRAGRRTPEPGSALDVVVGHRDAGGGRLAPRTAAVELLNVLRPTVAVARFVVFAALALHLHPQWRERLRDVRDDELRWFVQEVRRTAPFFPATAARARESFTWEGVRVPRGRRLLVDLYGSDRHPLTFPDPSAFRPERFADGEGDAYDLVPQGAGDHATGHRCPGEWVTIALVGRAVRAMVSDVGWTVPPQDLTVDLRRVPALPASGFVVSGVRRR
ncbi:cytochrome P450 [Thalassiella azotivora]